MAAVSGTPVNDAHRAATDTTGMAHGRFAAPLLLLVSTMVSAHQPPASRLTAPSLRVEIVGPAMVRLVADTPPGERVYQIGMRRRSDDGVADGRGLMPLRGESYRGTHWTGLDSVRAGTTYRYQARAESGTSLTAASDWSTEIGITTPPPPRVPPAAPIAFTARAVDAMRVELAWRNRSRNEYGFEILTSRDGPLTRIGLANPGTTRVVVHGRRPGSTARYAVRAFNPAGGSTMTPAIAVTQPATYDTADTAASSSTGPMGACVTREQAVAAVDAGAIGDERMPAREMRDAIGGFEALPVPGTCGNANCDWHVYSVDGACYRMAGELFTAGIGLIGRTPAGAPLFLDLGHMGGMRTNVAVRTIGSGGFVEMDRFELCEAPDGELTALTPVFEECQFDQDLGRE